jgi:hypothetical protein
VSIFVDERSQNQPLVFPQFREEEVSDSNRQTMFTPNPFVVVTKGEKQGPKEL